MLNGNESVVGPWITMEGRSPLSAFSPDFQVLQEQFSPLWEEVWGSHGCVSLVALWHRSKGPSCASLTCNAPMSPHLPMGASKVYGTLPRPSTCGVLQGAAGRFQFLLK